MPTARSEHEPNPSAIEERNVRGLEQQFESQDIPVENYGPPDIAYRDSDLPDGGKTECH